MISATNSSTAQIDSVNISANIPTEISSLGNLQINGVPFSGDIVSGINVGPISSQNTNPQLPTRNYSFFVIITYLSKATILSFFC